MTYSWLTVSKLDWIQCIFAISTVFSILDYGLTSTWFSLLWEPVHVWSSLQSIYKYSPSTVDVTENYFVYKVQVEVVLTFLLFPLRRIVLLTRRMIPVLLEKNSYKINIIIAHGKEIELRSGNNHGKVSSNKLYSNPITCFYASHTYVSRLLLDFSPWIRIYLILVVFNLLSCNFPVRFQCG